MTTVEAISNLKHEIKRALIAVIAGDDSFVVNIKNGELSCGEQEVILINSNVTFAQKNKNIAWSDSSFHRM